MSKSNISYLDYEINPVKVEGFNTRINVHCTKASLGCGNCFAESLNNRFGNKIPFDNRPVTFKLDLSVFDTLPKHKSAVVGVQFMSDLFHEQVPAYFQEQIIDEIYTRPQHKFLILTKRPKSMRDLMDVWSANREGLIPQNLGIGVSVENNDYLWRIGELCKIPAAFRFVSFEPLLGDVGEIPNMCHPDICIDFDCIEANFCPYEKEHLNWAVVGCESGAHRRPCKQEWIASVVNQCQDAGIPIFVKQMEINGKVEHDMSKFPKHLRFQQLPEWMR